MSIENTGYTINRWCYIQSCNFNLNANIGEFFGFGQPSSLTINPRKNIVVINQILGRFVINMQSGAHDAAMTVTLDIDGTLTSRVITIPASGGAAILSDEGDTAITADSAFSYKIEGGGGAGNSAMMGYSQESH